MTMLPSRAVEMQKEGQSVTAIAEALGVTVQQVVSWWGYMGYDPVAHHIETIARQVQDGTALYDALTACGIGLTSGPAVRVRAILRERGIGWHSSDSPHGSQRRIRERLKEGEMLCRECDVITPAHDSGLCPACRGDEEGNDEHKAWLEFEAGWLRRNLCVKRA